MLKVENCNISGQLKAKLFFLATVSGPRSVMLKGSGAVFTVIGGGP